MGNGLSTNWWNNLLQGKSKKNLCVWFKNRQKVHQRWKRFIYLLQYLRKNPERQKLRGSAMTGAAIKSSRETSVCAVCAQCVCSVYAVYVGLQVGVSRSWSLTFDDVVDVAAQLVFALRYCELSLRTQQHTGQHVNIGALTACEHPRHVRL